jgi:hypothetical protein
MDYGCAIVPTIVQYHDITYLFLLRVLVRTSLIISSPDFMPQATLIPYSSIHKTHKSFLQTASIIASTSIRYYQHA